MNSDKNIIYKIVTNYDNCFEAEKKIANMKDESKNNERKISMLSNRDTDLNKRIADATAAEDELKAKRSAIEIEEGVSVKRLTDGVETIDPEATETEEKQIETPTEGVVAEDTGAAGEAAYGKKKDKDKTTGDKTNKLV